MELAHHATRTCRARTSSRSSRATRPTSSGSTRRSPRARPSPRRSSASSPRSMEQQEALITPAEGSGHPDQGPEGDRPPDVHGRGQGAPRQARDDRGQPAPRDLDRQEVHQPRPAVPRPHPGRQHRPDEGGGQVRIPPRLQVLDLRHVVDPPGHHALDRRPGAHHPHPGAHDRDDQQDEPHLAPDPAGDRAASRIPRRWP